MKNEIHPIEPYEIGQKDIIEDLLEWIKSNPLENNMKDLKEQEYLQAEGCAEIETQIKSKYDIKMEKMEDIQKEYENKEDYKK